MGIFTKDYKFTATFKCNGKKGKINSVCTAGRWYTLVDVVDEIEKVILEKYPGAENIHINIDKV